MRIGFLLALIGTMALGTDAWAGRHYVTGVVTDRNGDPVDSAIISLSPGGVQLVTDRDGQFLIDYLRDDEGNRVNLSKKTSYKIEVFKAGFHVYATSTWYKKGPLELAPIALVEETIAIDDNLTDLDPANYPTSTHSAGANYEGQ